MTDIRDFEAQVRACFPADGIQKLSYGNEPWIDTDKMYVAITEDDNWTANKCVLKDWFFDYKAFKELPLQIDCVSYGVYVVWKR